MVIQMLILIILFHYQRHGILRYQQKIIKNYQSFLAKDLKKQFIRLNLKQNVRIKIRQMNIDIFLNQIFLEPIDYLF